MESLGSVAEVDSRDQVLKNKLGDLILRKEREIKELLTRHLDLIDPATINRIVSREVDEAVNRFIEKRLMGQSNDQYSLEPGVHVCVTDKGKESILQCLKARQFDVSEIVLDHVDNDLWEIDLPEWIYSTHETAEDIDFHARNQFNSHTFSIDTKYIVRVRSSRGHLWQNSNFTPEGLRRLKPTSAGL